MWMMAHELHGGVGEGVHGGANEVEGPVEKKTLGNGRFRGFFYLQKGRDSCKPGLFAQTAPHHDLLQNFLLRGVVYAPNHVVIPYVLKTIANTGPAGGG